MSQRKKPQSKTEFRAGRTAPQSFTPVNRRKDGVLFRQIGEKIRAGYYESSQVLQAIAERISGTK